MTLAAASAARILARFTGRLNSAFLIQQDNSDLDITDPTALPTSTAVAYACEGYSFDYELRDIDGTRIIKGDYIVVLLRGSLSVLPVDGDVISIQPPGGTTAASGRVVRVEAVTEAQVTLQVRGGLTAGLPAGFEGALEAPLS